MADIQALLSALDVFSRAPDKASLESANSWLQDFQRLTQPEAWAACNVLLQSPDSPVPAKLFAAQTFRSKVTYDLHQVAPENLSSLRDTIIAALHKYHTGPRNVIIQLCLALAGLALQLPSWENPVQHMMQSFGTNADTVPIFLQFLTTLPEELTGNAKIPVTDDEYRERATALMTDNAKKLLELLSMYYGATGVTPTLRLQIFQCLRSWLVAGEITAYDFVQTPLFLGVFESLAADDLFESAVDVICEVIHETQELEDNMNVIEAIVPRLIELKPDLTKYHDDPDRIRGYARIFTEAGETYRLLILEHPDTFFPLVEAIGVCSAYPDLDIVPVTFPFWMRLAQNIGKRQSISPLFLDAYRSLMGVVINHLHFPSDTATMSDQETDAFRSFRHVMGDTLKDCCFVLRPETCLLATYQMITTALARGPEGVSWQAIEAPLFALRSMGAEVDPNDNVAVPQIMDLIPSLPDHPKVQYAALLIIARYTEWIAVHPNYLTPQLQYVSAGFETGDPEVCAAAGQALKYICQDCKSLLIDFLPTLHTFLGTTGTKLLQEDRKQVYEAIAHVISAMKPNAAAESLKTFSLDILAQVHSLSLKTTPPTKEEMEVVINGLENLEILLKFYGRFGEDIPPACEKTCLQAWEVLDPFLVKFGNNLDVVDIVTQVLRRGLDLFGDSALSVAPAVVARMSFSFESTGLASYLWVPGKIISRFGNDEDPQLRGSFKEFYERSTQKVVSFLQTKAPREIPDVLEDYIQTLTQLVDLAPDIFFESSSFPLAFRAALGGLQVVHSDVIFVSLRLFQAILTHECLEPRTTPPPPKFPIYLAAIKHTIEKEGFSLLGCLLTGLIGDFPEEFTTDVVTVFRALCKGWPTQMIAWLPPILEQIPATTISPSDKQKFLEEVQVAVNTFQFEKVRYGILLLTRAARKTRERRRNGV
ncbi:mRNA transport regulator [Coprinopsis marcescibilis]|uniref:mRNA transport regulator n=1 Tax=Coprinopsis marcescibilis TaxID=230819 RepID=A0A5C3LBC9_COPMA|nr:mRNA transport regulator [Coprinopsis marcescibilis]